VTQNRQRTHAGKIGSVAAAGNGKNIGTEGGESQRRKFHENRRYFSSGCERRKAPSDTEEVMEEGGVRNDSGIGGVRENSSVYPNVPRVSALSLARGTLFLFSLSPVVSIDDDAVIKRGCTSKLRTPEENEHSVISSRSGHLCVNISHNFVGRGSRGVKSVFGCGLMLRGDVAERPCRTVSENATRLENEKSCPAKISQQL